MRNEIKLLDASFLDDVDKLREITYWLNVMNRPNGWHYDLDHIWILKELEKSGIQPGATILDAGAGIGIMQFLLAARGHCVISLDFAVREPPPCARNIFVIDMPNGNEKLNYHHSYMDYMRFVDQRKPISIIGKIKGTLTEARSKEKGIRFISNKVVHKIICSIRTIRSYRLRCIEMRRPHDSFGRIKFVRAAFHDMPLDSGSVDAVISISALEHADISLLDANLGELMRVVKANSPVLITTSATDSDRDIYHEKSQGWCFTLSTLNKIAPDADTNFDYASVSLSLTDSKLFKSRLDPYYYLDSDCFCYRKQITTYPYLPVGLSLHKP